MAGYSGLNRTNSLRMNVGFKPQTVAPGKTNREDVQSPVGGKTNFGGTVGYKGDTRVQRVAPGKGDLQISSVPKTTKANPIGRRYASPIGPKQPGLTRGLKPLGNTPIAPVPKLKPTVKATTPTKKATSVKTKASTKTSGNTKSVKTTPTKTTQAKTPVGMSRKEAMNNRLGVSSKTTTGKTSSSSSSKSSPAKSSSNRGFTSGSLKDRSTGGVSTGTKTGKTTSSKK